MLCCEGRHLATIRAGVLQRTYDQGRELWRGGLYFRCDLLTLAQRAGATEILATERATRRRYRLSLDLLLKHGHHYDHERFGAQLGLSLNLWEQVGEPGAPRQLALWGAEP